MPLSSKTVIVRRFAPIFLLLIALVSTFLVYQRGLSGAFVFDDGPNIIGNTSIAIENLNLDSLRQAALSTASGPLRRPISMLSFAINYYLTGFNPFYFKITNLAIHLFNGIGIFVLTTILLDIYRRRFQPCLSPEYLRWVSLAVASAWLLHPFNLTSVLYIVQRMTSLSALFTIWGLTLYMWGRSRLYEGKSGITPILASLLLFTPLATLSKENGALLPLLMLITEITLFNFHVEKLSARRFLIVFFVLTAAIPAAAALVYFAADPNRLLGGYAGRGFTLAERVMTEARVLWFYIRSIVLPNIAQMGLFHDDIINSRGLLQPISTLFSLIGLVAMLGLLFVTRKKAPLITFGILFFLGGHILESTVIALEITHEHRNYLPMYGLLLILFFYMLYPLRYTTNLHARQVAAILLIGLFAFSTFARSNKWANPFELAESEVAHHPNSPRTNGEMANIYANMGTDNKIVLEQNYLLARFHYEKAVELSANYTNGLFGLIILSADRGKTIESEWITKLTQRLKHAAYAPDISNHLLKLVTCQMNGICRLAKNEIEGILQAPLQNPTLTGPNRALALSALSLYLVNIARDYPAALTVMYQTVESVPQEPEYRLSLIKFLIALQRHNEARTQLAILKSMDKMQIYTAEIESQGKLLGPVK